MIRIARQGRLSEPSGKGGDAMDLRVKNLAAEVESF